MSLATVGLRLAFRECGCPVCRLRQQAERRYLFTLLYENVNDGGARSHLVRGLGLCQEHAWALQAVEQERWHDGLGVGIIYEDLAGRVLASLTEYLEQNSLSRADTRARLGQRLESWGAMGRWLARRLLPSAPGASLLAHVSPAARCRACEIVDRMGRVQLDWLLQGLAEPEFRDLYGASDGLCLPHLRRALAGARAEQAVHCLAEVAAAQLGPLVHDLKEYVRKRDWNNREEPKQLWEQASWVRAVAFFAGEAPQAEGEDVYRLRREATAAYHQRGEIQAR